MFRFFRKLRENLLAKNQASHYMLYALGEIVLVVIGILIALQINTWNEERQNRQQEKGIVSTLRQEFLTNRLVLNEVLTRLEKTRKANIALRRSYSTSFLRGNLYSHYLKYLLI